MRAYVRAVRAWLGDLPADEVEDLTAGMEADLAERAAESGGPLGGLLGEPEAYAAELRSAAGLPPRVDVVVAPDAVRARAVDRPPGARRARAGGPASVAARAATDLVAGAGCRRRVGRWPRSWAPGARCCCPLVGAALSMWLGLVLRRREPLGAGTRFALGAGNALAVVLLLPMLASYTSGSSDFSDEAAAMPGYPSQVVANGEPAQNLYAYDAAGNRLDGVRVYDQSGRALCRRPRVADGRRPTATCRCAPTTARRTSRADVFPLTWPGHDAWQDPGFGWTPPLTLPPLAGATGLPAPSAAATPSAPARRRARSPAPQPVP